MKTTSVNCTNCGKEFQKSISYIKQGQNRGYTNHFCSNACSCEYNKNSLVNKSIKRYYENPKNCLYCSTMIPYDKNYSGKKYCSSKCAAIDTQKNGGHRKFTDEDRKKVSDWAKINAHKFTHPNKKTGKYIKCKNCETEFYISPKSATRFCSRKCSDAWIVKTGYLIGKGGGGYRPNSGTSKKGWYKGYFCGSSWELAWVIYNLDFGIKFERNKTGFDYIFEHQPRKYYPDFICSDEYIEIKGYHSKQFDAKLSQFPHKLTVLHEKDLEHILEYVVSKYGKDFTKLYNT